MDDLVENLHPAQNLHRTRGKKKPGHDDTGGFLCFCLVFFNELKKKNTCLFPKPSKRWETKTGDVFWIKVRGSVLLEMGICLAGLFSVSPTKTAGFGKQKQHGGFAQHGKLRNDGSCIVKSSTTISYIHSQNSQGLETHTVTSKRPAEFKVSKKTHHLDLIHKWYVPSSELAINSIQTVSCSPRSTLPDL